MARCDYCGSTILFGGKRQGEFRFRNAKCSARRSLLALSSQVPESMISENLMRVHQGSCPECGGSGPVDVHVSHKVWSAVLLTRWYNTPQISCRDCRVKNQLKGVAFSLVLGWWGIPWGFVLTPIQVGRNVIAMLRSPDSAKPSAQLEKAVRMDIAAQILDKQRADKASAVAPA
jgi:hypothetical protein